MTDITAPTQATASVEALIARHLQGLRFGEVVIHVHDGRVVQIERTERVRPTHQPPLP